MTQLLEVIDTPTEKALTTRFYRPELDVLRFGAFLLVLVKHSFPSPEGPGLRLHVLRALKHAGFFGVPLFFLLSAYLITELLLKEQLTTGSIRVRAFYLRRVLRIWPLYLGMLIIACIYGRIHHAVAIPRAELAFYLLLIGNWYTVFHGYIHGFGLPLWSIGVEEQFYLLWPSLVRWGGQRGLIAASAIMICSAQVTLLILSHKGVTIAPTIEANSLVEFQFFALGAVISVVLKGRVPGFTLLQRLGLSLFGLLCCFLADFLFYAASGALNATVRHTVPGFALAAAGTVLIFFSTLGAKIPKKASAVIYLGKISFGLYIFHLACVHFATHLARTYFHLQHDLLPVVWGIGLPLTILVSATSYRYFETPFLRLKERFTVVHSRTI